MPQQCQQAQCEGKFRYHSSHAAGRAIRRHATKMRAYRCPHCGGWHLAYSQARGTTRKRATK